MSYIASALQDNETLLHASRASVLPYLPGMLGGAALIPSVIAYPAPFFPGALSILGACVAVLFAALWLATEMGITDRRVIIKTGLFYRTVRELHLSRIEGVDVEQSIVGRIFNYGTILVRGVGTDLEPVDYISRPEPFKRAFFDASAPANILDAANASTLS